MFLAIALFAVGAQGQHSDGAQEFHVAFPLRDHVGDVLQPSLLEGLDLFVGSIAKHIKSSAAVGQQQWEDDEFFKHNNVSTNNAVCFTVNNDTSPAEQDGTETLMSMSNATFAGNKAGSVTTKAGHAVGHWCCAGHLPNSSQLASANCYRTDAPRALDQAREGGSFLQATVSADGSSMTSSVRSHAHSGLVRSAKMEAQGEEEVSDPRIFPTQIFVASLRDGLGSDSLDSAVEQVAHLARATSGLIVVDQRLFGRLMKELGSHPARFRVIEKPFWLVVFWFFVYAFQIGASVGISYGISQIPGFR